MNFANLEEESLDQNLINIDLCFEIAKQLLVNHQ